MRMSVYSSQTEFTKCEVCSLQEWNTNTVTVTLTFHKSQIWIKRLWNCQLMITNTGTVIMTVQNSPTWIQKLCVCVYVREREREIGIWETNSSHRRPGFNPRSGQVGFVVDKVVPGQVFSEYFGFPCQSSFHRLLHNHLHLSSGAGTIGQ
jgi:hypothetical protein